MNTSEVQRVLEAREHFEALIALRDRERTAGSADRDIALVAPFDLSAAFWPQLAHLALTNRDFIQR